MFVFLTSNQWLISIPWLSHLGNKIPWWQISQKKVLATYVHLLEPLEDVKLTKYLNNLNLFASAHVSCEISALLLNYFIKKKLNFHCIIICFQIIWTQCLVFSSSLAQEDWPLMEPQTPSGAFGNRCSNGQKISEINKMRFKGNSGVRN